MATASIPVLICKEIEKMARRFLWESSRTERKPALVKWNHCCKPVLNGGLEIRKNQDQNKLFLLKIGYNIIVNFDALWVRMPRNKYSIHRLILEVITQSNTSHLWQALTKVWDEVKDGLIWIILLEGWLISGTMYGSEKWVL